MIPILIPIPEVHPISITGCIAQPHLKGEERVTVKVRERKIGHISYLAIRYDYFILFNNYCCQPQV